MGEGVFGVVKSAKDKGNGKRVAIKEIQQQIDTQEQIELIENEIEVMQNLKHPNIVELYESFAGKDMFYLVMEFVDGCELFELILEFGSFTIEDSSAVLSQVLHGVEYMHAHGMAHRDLKPENLLVDFSQLIVKIADFGSAKVFSPTDMMNNFVGSPTYIAPEILLRKPYDQSVDMWSIGVIAYIMFCGFPPFDDRLTTEEMFLQIISGKYEFPSPEWDLVPLHCVEFVKDTLRVNPKERATATMLLEKHGWLRSSPQYGKKRRLNQQGGRTTNEATAQLHQQFSQRLQQHHLQRKATFQKFKSIRNFSL
uniref:non-specific serine/threonine protein kinase n=1 Tax=Arcella intermedia TaxID=1963864 RepID=A0A6B2LAB4_9EUKA